MAAADRIAAGPRRGPPPPRWKVTGQGVVWSEDVVTNTELIRRLAPNWPTIVSDLNHAGRNGLRQAAAVPVFGHGMYFLQRAQQWAQDKGKWRADAPSFPSLFAQRG